MPTKPEELAEKLCGVVLAAVTPFQEDFSLDPAGMKSNVEQSVADGLVNGQGALLIAGGGGEIPFMTPDERVQVVAAAVEGSAGRVPIIAGVQDDGVARSSDVARRMQDVGADGIQLGPPCMYGPHPLEDIYRYYEAVCGAIEIGVLAYNTWWTSAPFTPEFLLQLNEIDNVVGIKWSAPRNWDYLQGYRLAADKLVMIDNQGMTIDAHLMGAKGFISGVGDFYPQHDLKIWRHCQAGEYREAFELIRKLSWPIYEFRVRVGKSTGGEASAKKAMAALVGRAAGPPRPPTRPCTPEEVADVRRIMEAAGVPGLV